MQRLRSVDGGQRVHGVGHVAITGARGHRAARSTGPEGAADIRVETGHHSMPHVHQMARCSAPPTHALDPSSRSLPSTADTLVRPTSSRPRQAEKRGRTQGLPGRPHPSRGRCAPRIRRQHLAGSVSAGCQEADFRCLQLAAKVSCQRRPGTHTAGHNRYFPTRSQFLSTSTYERQVSGDESEAFVGSTRP